VETQKFSSLLVRVVLGVAAFIGVVVMLFSVILFASQILPALNVTLEYNTLYMIMVGGMGCLGVIVTHVIIIIIMQLLRKKGKGTDNC